jgi:hypothetical protein
MAGVLGISAFRSARCGELDEGDGAGIRTSSDACSARERRRHIHDRRAVLTFGVTPSSPRSAF